jgi:hypothetical protein
VLEYLSWVFVGEVFVREDINFTPKALFHSPNFGEGIVLKANYFSTFAANKDQCTLKTE